MFTDLVDGSNMPAQSSFEFACCARPEADRFVERRARDVVPIGTEGDEDDGLLMARKPSKRLLVSSRIPAHKSNALKKIELKAHHRKSVKSSLQEHNSSLELE